MMGGVVMLLARVVHNHVKAKVRPEVKPAATVYFRSGPVTRRRR